MEPVAYVIGVLLVIVSVELLILIIEVVRLSSSLRDFFLNRGSAETGSSSRGKDRSTREHRESGEAAPDQDTLRALLAQLTEESTRKTSYGAGTDGIDRTASAGTGEGPVSDKPQEVSEGRREAAQGEGPEAGAEAASTAPPESEARRQAPRRRASSSAASNTGAPQAPPETQTQATTFAVRTCASCGRENSALRKDCYFCGSVLPESE